MREASHHPAAVVDPDLPAAKEIQPLRTLKAGGLRRGELVGGEVLIAIVGADHDASLGGEHGRTERGRCATGPLVEVEPFVRAVAVGAFGAREVSLELGDADVHQREGEAGQHRRDGDRLDSDGLDSDGLDGGGLAGDGGLRHVRRRALGGRLSLGRR